MRFMPCSIAIPAAVRSAGLARFLPATVLAVLIVAVAVRSPAFLSVSSVQVLLASASVFGLLAAGQLVVVVS